MKRVIPRELVRVKNEVAIDLRYLTDPRAWSLASSSEAAHAVTYQTYAGLANRLRAHYAAEIVATRLARSVIPLWLRTEQLASDGSDVFPAQPVARPTPHVPRFRRIALADAPRMLDALRDSRDLIVLAHDAQWSSFDATRKHFAHDATVAITIAPPVVAGAGAHLAAIVRPALAVHVRRGDFVTHTPYAKDDSYFEREIAAACERRRFATLVIASDSSVSLVERMARRFDAVVVLAPRFARAQVGVAAEALEHVLVLAGCDGFIPSPQSSFSELVEAIRCERVRFRS